MAIAINKKSKYPMSTHSINQKGFTFVELLVAVSLFGIIVGMASETLVLSIKAQRRSLLNQEVLDQTSYLMEYLSRSIRMAKKELAAPNCLSQNGLNYEWANISGQPGLKFRDYKGICQGFFLENGQLKRWKEGPAGGVACLTSANLEVASFKVRLFGESQTDDLQPRVTIFLEIKSKEGAPTKIQTTISQRDFDIVK